MNGQRQIEIGDIIPGFRLIAKGGEAIDPTADHIAGKPLVLVFQPAGGALPGGLAELGAKVKGLAGRAMVIGRGNVAGAPEGFDLLSDSDGKVHAGYGMDGSMRIVVVAPNRHEASVGDDTEAASRALDRIAATRGTVSMTSHPPVLVIPDVLSREDCQKLINIFAMQGQTFVEPGHGVADTQVDYKMRIPEYGRKDRIDHWIMQPSTNAFIDDRFKRRLFPEIQKSFHYRITKRELMRIGLYEGERGGELHGHRDNTKPQVAHRRFACSVNLNSEQFEGGAIRFPEYGDQRYRPETGAAIVFSSSLLHEAMHVTAGKRFVLLSFLYGDT
jgi:hypothetical protein